MTILTTIPNGASLKDIRDTMNSVLARVLALEGNVGTPTPTPTPTPSPTPTPKVLAEGDSITADTGSYSRIWAAANPSVAYSNMAVGGSAISGSISLNARKADALAYNATHMTLLIGANDMNDYASADAFLTAVFNYTASFRSAGTKVALGTVLPRTGATGWNARRAEVNAKIRTAVGLSIDEVIDFDTSSMGIDGAENNASLYPDGLHPDATGKAIMAAVHSPVLNGMLGIANEPQGMSFTPVTGATADTDQTSAAYTVKGLYRLESRPYSIQAGRAVSKNGGAFVIGGSGTVANGDTLRVRLRSSATPAAQVDAVLTIGSTTATFSVSTAGAGTRDWVPTDLGAKLAMWLKPETLPGSADGIDVNTWPDSGPRNLALAGGSGGGSARPTLALGAVNGFKALRTNTGFMEAPPNLVTGRTSMATFFVSANDADPSVNEYGSPISGWGSDGGQDYYPFFNGGVYSTYGNTVRRDNMDPAPSLAAWRVGMFSSAPNDWRYTLDGTDVATFAANTVATGTAARVGGGAGKFLGRVSEVVDMSEAPTTAERQRVEGYLAWKFGLQANLPAAHPYKSAKPTI